MVFLSCGYILDRKNIWFLESDWYMHSLGFLAGVKRAKAFPNVKALSRPETDGALPPNRPDQLVRL